MQKALPYLLLSDKLIGAYIWQLPKLIVEGVCDMQFENEGPDTLMQDKDYEDVRIPSELVSYLYL
jgi:hypothetical protein